MDRGLERYVLPRSGRGGARRGAGALARDGGRARADLSRGGTGVRAGTAPVARVPREVTGPGGTTFYKKLYSVSTDTFLPRQPINNEELGSTYYA